MTVLTVTSNADSGSGTLREAITNAEQGATITFDSTLHGSTITLSAELKISKTLIIDASNLWNLENDGPGLTISGANASRVFNITRNGTSDVNVELTGLRITEADVGTGYGGGVYWNGGGTLKISNSEIVGNVASRGGGLRLTSGVTTLINCVVSGNVSSGYGGGLYADNVSSVLFKNGSIVDNMSTSHGGGVYWTSSGSLTVLSCRISDNESSAQGGGVRMSSGSATFTNALVSGNKASSVGGVHFSGSATTATFVNCTIAGNAASQEAAAAYFMGGPYEFYNSIIATNTANQTIPEMKRGSTTTVNAYNTLSSYEGWTNKSVTDVVNYPYDDSKPLFVDAANGDYRLINKSFAVNKGDNIYVDTLTDLDGNTRILDATVDLGCYEGSWFVVSASGSATIGAKTTANYAEIGSGATITFAAVDSDLVITTGATIKTATFSAREGLIGYLATPLGTVLTNATFNGVKASTYGAGASGFSVAVANPTTATLSWASASTGVPVLLEIQEGDGWTTLSASATSPYVATLESVYGRTFRIFDGASFLTVDTPYEPFDPTKTGFYQINDRATLNWNITSWVDVANGGDGGREGGRAFTVSNWAIAPDNY